MKPQIRSSLKALTKTSWHYTADGVSITQILENIATIYIPKSFIFTKRVMPAAKRINSILGDFTKAPLKKNIVHEHRAQTLSEKSEGAALRLKKDLKNAFINANMVKICTFFQTCALQIGQLNCIIAFEFLEWIIEESSKHANIQETHLEILEKILKPCDEQGFGCKYTFNDREHRTKNLFTELIRINREQRIRFLNKEMKRIPIYHQLVNFFVEKLNIPIHLYGHYRPISNHEYDYTCWYTSLLCMACKDGAFEVFVAFAPYFPEQKPLYMWVYEYLRRGSINKPKLIFYSSQDNEKHMQTLDALCQVSDFDTLRDTIQLLTNDEALVQKEEYKTTVQQLGINQATLDAQPAILSRYLQTMKEFYESELEKRHLAYASQIKSRLQKPEMTPQQARLAEADELIRMTSLAARDNFEPVASDEVNVYFSEPESEREDSDSDASTY